MSDQDAFERILAALHAATLDETQWPATSALIDEACGIQGTALLVGDGPPEAPRVLFAQLYYRGHSRADLMHEYLENYLPLDESVPRVRHLPASHLVHITALYTTEELQTSPAYNEMLPSLRAQDSLNVRLDGLEGLHITWDIADPVTRGGWATPQLALLRGLLPHIRQLVQVRQALACAEAIGASATELLATSRVGVLHLDRQGRLVAANDRARALLRRGDGMVDRAGELRARAAGVARLVVHVLPVGVQQPDFGAPRIAALVLLVEPGRLARLDPGLVARALDLTLTESQIAVWLAAGQTVREMAAATGRQGSSIRWHLKQIYRKQGLAGQADLVRLVLSLAVLA